MGPGKGQWAIECSKNVLSLATVRAVPKEPQDRAYEWGFRGFRLGLNRRLLAWWAGWQDNDDAVCWLGGQLRRGVRLMMNGRKASGPGIELVVGNVAASPHAGKLSSVRMRKIKCTSQLPQQWRGGCSRGRPDQH